MKLILHHLLKDIRAQRWLLLLWALVLLIPLLLNALVFQPDYDTARYIETLRVSPLFLFIYVIVWTILVARLIQSDPVTGSTSFWLTRPIPTWVYIPSKLIFLLGLVILPGALSLVASDLQMDCTQDMIQDHLLTFGVVQAIGMLGVVWLATYTPGLLHFAGTLCVGLLGLFLVSLLTVALSHPRPGNGIFAADHLAVILIPGLFISLIVQHWRRRRQSGLVVGVTAIALALIAQVCLPPPASTAEVEPFVSSGNETHIDFLPDWQKSVEWGRNQNDTEAMSVLKPVDAQYANFIVESVAGQFQAEGENPVFLSLKSSNQFTPYFQFQFKRVGLVRAALPDDTINLPNNVREGDPPVTLFTLPAAQKLQLQGKTGSITLNLHGYKMVLIQEASLPLDQPHFIARIPGGLIRSNLSTDPDDPKIVIWKVSSEKNSRWMQEMIYVLVDPKNRTGTIVEPGGSSSSSNSIGGSYHTMDSEMTLNPGGNDTLDQKLLYIFRVTPDAPFQATLTAPNFTMNPK